jgi:tellurite resistance protein TehA-like permease
MTTRFKPPIVPAAFFGIVLGLAGLGSAWRAAHQVWHLPAMVGETLMALLLLRLLPWIMEQPFSVSYCGFTFAIAFALAPIRMAGHRDADAIALLAPYLFAGANIVVGLIFLGTLRLSMQGRLLPQAAPATAPQAVVA